MEPSIMSTSCTKRVIWLIGGLSERIAGSKLPSNRQVLSSFFYLHILQKKIIHESATNVAQELLSFWNKARIPTRQPYHVIEKIKKQHQKWKGLQKSALRRTKTTLLKEHAFTSVIDDLFDVAHADALSLIKISEDRQFLIAHREKGRHGCLGSVHMKLYRVEKRRCCRAGTMESRKKSEDEHAYEDMWHQLDSDSDNTMEIPDLEGLNHAPHHQLDSDSDNTVEIIDLEVTNHAQHMSAAKNAVNIVSSDVASSLDRAKVSDCNSIFILASVAKALGHDPSELALNIESVRQARRQHREITTHFIKEAFDIDGPYTI